MFSIICTVMFVVRAMMLNPSPSWVTQIHPRNLIPPFASISAFVAGGSICSALITDCDSWHPLNEVGASGDMVVVGCAGDELMLEPAPLWLHPTSSTIPEAAVAQHIKRFQSVTSSSR